MKQNGVVCLPGPAFLFFIFRFEYLISGPKSYRDFRETAPSFLFVSNVANTPATDIKRYYLMQSRETKIVCCSFFHLCSRTQQQVHSRKALITSFFTSLILQQ